MNVLRLNPPRAHANDVNQAAKALSEAENPVLLAGGGSIRAAASIVKLAQRLDAPVVMTVNARGVMCQEHALAISASASLPAVRKLIARADVVLGIGTEMGPTDYDFNEDGLLDLPARFIRIDVDAQQLVRNHTPKLGLVGDSAATVEDLINALERYGSGKETSYGPDQLPQTSGTARAATARDDTINSLSPRDRQYLNILTHIRSTLPDVIIAGDSTQIIYTGNCAFGMNEPLSWFNSAMGFGTLGYALPGAIGAAIGHPQRPVVAISGDGGLQFCLAELATAVDEQLKLTLIVHENGGYHEIEKSMHADDIEPVGVNLMVPDLEMIASACGWRCTRLNTLDELAGLLLAARDNSAPTLLLVPDALFDVNDG